MRLNFSQGQFSNHILLFALRGQGAAVGREAISYGNYHIIHKGLKKSARFVPQGSKKSTC